MAINPCQSRTKVPHTFHLTVVNANLDLGHFAQSTCNAQEKCELLDQTCHQKVTLYA
jgi:hypothetical protein